MANIPSQSQIGKKLKKTFGAKTATDGGASGAVAAETA